MPQSFRSRCLLVTLLACFNTAGLAIWAQERVSLMDPVTALDTWTFNNGQEFPGATGSLQLDPETQHDGKESLKLIGDFTGGGGYVQAGRKLDRVDIQELSFWVRTPETDKFTLRLGDASGQTHQIVIKIEPGTAWQRIDLPIDDFFEKRGQADALTNIAKYESWGGAKDGNWHGPATGIYLLLAKAGENAVRTLWLSDIAVTLKPTPVAGAEMRSEVALSEVVDGIHDWRFSNGGEVKGAVGSLVAEGADLRLSGDFTGGGAYVAAIRDLEWIDAAEVPAIRMEIRSEQAKSVTIQVVDATGQTHQRKALPIVADGNWNDFEVVPERIAGGEHWGGANDGKWHHPPRRFVISITTRSDPNLKPAISLRDVRAEAVFPVFAEPAAYSNPEPLQLSRTLEQVNEPRTLVTPAFPATEGQWRIQFDVASKLVSPDNSYSGVLDLEALNAAGDVLDRFNLIDIFGDNESTPTTKIIELPKGTASGRFQAELNKTYGEFRIDHLSAAYLAPAPVRDDRIERLLFATSQLGNLLFPEDSREVAVTLLARKPLSEAQKNLTYVVRDYWGAEQMKPGHVQLGEPKKEKDGWTYQTTIDLSTVPLEIGRYYELYAETGINSRASRKVEPFRNYTSLAILPEAVTRQYRPEEVPFTARNWDNRIQEYIRLTDRLGIRICGLWGGWSPKPPYQPTAPGLELCQELGMGWLRTTPIKHIEDGKDDEWSETALRQGVRNFLETYGHVRPLIINLGNEPHGTGERVRKNVAAYRTVYEEIKKIDPTIPVVATSVEPNEEYFQNGYGQWCDAFDFHIYEQPENVRRNMEHYGELMKKYDVVKPIWSTELGLNSQGQPRHEVAVQIFQKFSTFFAAGGENVSWFGLLYPDPEGKQHGTSGDSHNVFDCRYNRYAPRLDAVAYYHAVNAIAIKKFVEERHYPNGIHAFLFRDREGKSLQILWNEKGQADVQIPLPGVEDVLVRRIDGSSSKLAPEGRGVTVTVTVTGDPLVLTYERSDESLPAEFAAPSVQWINLPEKISARHPSQLTVQLADTSAKEITLTAPPFWNVEPSATNRGSFLVTPPASSSIREAEFVLTIGNTGQLYVRLPVGD